MAVWSKLSACFSIQCWPGLKVCFWQLPQGWGWGKKWRPEGGQRLPVFLCELNYQVPISNYHRDEERNENLNVGKAPPCLSVSSITNSQLPQGWGWGKRWKPEGGQRLPVFLCELSEGNLADWWIARPGYEFNWHWHWNSIDWKARFDWKVGLIQ